MSIYGNPIIIGKEGGGGGVNFLGGVRTNKCAIFGQFAKIGKLENANDTYFSSTDDDGNDLQLNTSQPFEVGMVVNFSDVRQQVCCLTGARNNVTRAPSIALDTNATNVVFAISTNGNQWASLLTVFPSGYSGLPTNTDILFKMWWDGTNWHGLVDDGTNTMHNSTPLGTPYYSSSYPMCFATQGSQGSYVPQNMYYDLHRIWMKSNGVLIWGNEA